MSAGKIIRYLEELQIAGKIGSFHYTAEAEHPWTLIVGRSDHLYSTREIEAFILGIQVMGK